MPSRLSPAAATRLIAERGLESLSFADIAGAAGISRPLIYFHFKDRDQLFHETVVRANQMLFARFEKAVAAHATADTLYVFHEQTGPRSLPLAPTDFDQPAAAMGRILQTLGL